MRVRRRRVGSGSGFGGASEGGGDVTERGIRRACAPTETDVQFELIQGGRPRSSGAVPRQSQSIDGFFAEQLRGIAGAGHRRCLDGEADPLESEAHQLRLGEFAVDAKAAATARALQHVYRKRTAQQGRPVHAWRAGVEQPPEYPLPVTQREYIRRQDDDVR